MDPYPIPYVDLLTPISGDKRSLCVSSVLTDGQDPLVLDLNFGVAEIFLFSISSMVLILVPCEIYWAHLRIILIGKKFTVKSGYEIMKKNGGQSGKANHFWSTASVTSLLIPPQPTY